MWRRPGGPEITHCETSAVTFQVLDEARIEAYLARVNPLDKAGSYAAQEHGETIIARIEGSFANVMGLPVERLRTVLESL